MASTKRCGCRNRACTLCCAARIATMHRVSRATLAKSLTQGHHRGRAGAAWTRRGCGVRRSARRRTVSGLAGLALPAQADAGRRPATRRRRRSELHTHAHRHVRSELDELCSTACEPIRSFPTSFRGFCVGASLAACSPARERLAVLRRPPRPRRHWPELVTLTLRCIRRPIRVESALFEGTVRVWVKVRAGSAHHHACMVVRQDAILLCSRIGAPHLTPHPLCTGHLSPWG